MSSGSESHTGGGSVLHSSTKASKRAKNVLPFSMGTGAAAPF